MLKILWREVVIKKDTNKTMCDVIRRKSLQTFNTLLNNLINRRESIRMTTKNITCIVFVSVKESTMKEEKREEERREKRDADLVASMEPSIKEYN